MAAAILVVIIIALVVVGLVFVAPRLGGTQLGRLGRSRRSPADDGPVEPRVRGRRHRSTSEHVLLAEGEEIQQRVEAQVSRNRASTEHRFRRNGRAEAARLAVPHHDPLAPGYGTPDPRMAEPGYAAPANPAPGYADPRYPDPRLTDPRFSDPRLTDPGFSDPRLTDPRYAEAGYVDPRHPESAYGQPVDEGGRPLVGRSRVEEVSAEDELRAAAARARAANIGRDRFVP